MLHLGPGDLHQSLQPQAYILANTSKRDPGVQQGIIRHGILTSLDACNVLQLYGGLSRILYLNSVMSEMYLLLGSLSETVKRGSWESALQPRSLL